MKSENTNSNKYEEYQGYTLSKRKDFYIPKDILIQNIDEAKKLRRSLQYHVVQNKLSIDYESYIHSQNVLKDHKCTCKVRNRADINT